jgi:hypothetical protein
MVQMVRKKSLLEILQNQSQFGRLRVLGEVDPIGRDRYVACICECGAECVAAIGSLKRGLTKSCGCYRREFSATKNLRHGERRCDDLTSREYETWRRIIQRTSNPKNPEFHNYGGRGIKVCDRWRLFENFLADMGRRPSDKHSIDRIDNDGSYEPGNCRWATASEQAANTRRVHWVVLNGKKMTLSSAAAISGLPQGTVSKRIASGWPESLWFAKTARSRGGIPADFRADKHWPE